MLCQKCQRDVQGGQPYTFYYGNQTGQVRRGNRTITSYQIGGSRQAFLCNDCVFTHTMIARARGFLWAAITFVVIACVAGFLATVASDVILATVFWLAVVMLLAYAFSLLMTSFVEKQRAANRDFETLSPSVRSNSGSGLAIVLGKPALQAAGYKVFFTPARMKELKITPARR